MNKPSAAAVLLLLGSVGLIVVVLTHVAEFESGLPYQSALMPTNFITLPHFSVSSAMSFPKSVVRTWSCTRIAIPANSVL